MEGMLFILVMIMIAVYAYSISRRGGIDNYEQDKELTPRQFYFPYFFDEEKFRQLIKPFGLTIKIEVNDKTQMPAVMQLQKEGTTKLTIHFWQQFMIDDSGSLIVWSTRNNLKISKYSLINGFQQKEFELDVFQLQIGPNQVENDLGLSNFATYIRSDKVKYDPSFRENFGILIIINKNVELIPFDWFNEKGGDYGYVWPALARIHLMNNLLIGEGMRMDKFKVKLRP